MIIATHGILASAAGFVGLLDLYPSAAAAYSLRKLRSAYTGSAIRVRRSSDNTEQNIGFTASGGLDTSSLTSFCGSGNGFVTTWYDQSGNANNATQTTASEQPQIVSSGSVIIKDSLPAIEQTGTKHLIVSNVIFTDAFFVLNVNVQSTINYFIEQNTSGTIGGFFANGNFSGVNGFGGFDGTNTRSLTGEDLNRHLAYYNMSGGNLNISRDGGSLTNLGSFTSSFTLTKLLGRAGLNLNLLGNAQEMIFYNANQSSNRTGISTNINSYYGIY